MVTSWILPVVSPILVALIDQRAAVQPQCKKGKLSLFQLALQNLLTKVLPVMVCMGWLDCLDCLDIMLGWTSTRQQGLAQAGSGQSRRVLVNSLKFDLNIMQPRQHSRKQTKYEGVQNNKC